MQVETDILMAMKPKKFIISDDTDVCLILIYLLHTGDIKANVFMQAILAESDKVLHIYKTENLT